VNLLIGHPGKEKENGEQDPNGMIFCVLRHERDPQSRFQPRKRRKRPLKLIFGSPAPIPEPRHTNHRERFDTDTL
jgi:hypothetical protein